MVSEQYDDGLQAHQREAIRSVFRQYPEIKKALLYGSRALGRHREASDIDITLIGNINLPTLNRISLALDDLLLPYEIDLSVFNLIENPDLIDHIKRVGRVFYQKIEQD